MFSLFTQDAKDQLDKLYAAINPVGHELEQVRSAITTAKAQIKQYDRQVVEIAGKVIELQQQCEAAKLRQQHHQQQIDKLQPTLDKLTAKHSDLRDKISSIKTQQQQQKHQQQQQQRKERFAQREQEREQKQKQIDSYIAATTNHND
jgi:chromosome segregation ATPase